MSGVFGWCTRDKKYKCQGNDIIKETQEYNFNKENINNELVDFDQSILGNWNISEKSIDYAEYINKNAHNYLDFSYNGYNKMRINGLGSVVFSYDKNQNVDVGGAYKNVIQPCTSGLGKTSCNGQNLNIPSITNGNKTCQNWGCFVKDDGSLDMRKCRHKWGSLTHLYNNWYKTDLQGYKRL